LSLSTLSGGGQEDHIINKNEYGDQNMMEETIVTLLDLLVQESLQLIYVDLEKSGQEGVPLFHPDGGVDEVRKLCVV
jgi:hypothetical protein